MAGDFIVKEIEKRIGGLSHLSTSKGDSLKGERRLSFSDFAVIFRTNEDVNLVKKSFEMSGIPYQIIGGRLEGQRDPLRRLMEKIASSLSESNEGGLKGLSLRQFLDICPFKEENESIIELVEGLFPFTPIGELLSELNLITPLDDYNPSFDSVTLTTMHRAKGLEFSCVFILGLEEGNIPFSRSKDYDIEEERRLLYVGMTRAKDELFLIRSKRGVPSHFLKEIPPELTETIDIGLKKKPKTLSLFDLCK
jgi:superfamily I DNA/RNA helicase